MRRFKLINAEGSSFDLNDKAAFFHSVDGFGYKEGTQYQQIGTEFYALDELFNQGQMSGQILFAGSDPYKKYREFTRFVRAVPLTLVYELDEVFKVPVRLSEIGKAELKSSGVYLNCDVTFLATGLFYKTVQKYSETISVGGKVYDYEYPYSYADVSQNTIVIDSDSYEDSPCKITIFGPAQNPVWKHYVNNELYEIGRYDGEIPVDHKLVIDSTSIPYSIVEKGVGDDVVADRYQMCDFTTERFFNLQHGINRISVTHEGLNTVNMLVEGKISYETV